MFNRTPKKESLQDILEVFTQTKTKLQEFIKDCDLKDAVIEAEMLELAEDRKENLETLSSAKTALTQINNIVGE